MKKLSLILPIICLFISLVKAQESKTSELKFNEKQQTFLAEILKMNSDVIKLYQEKKYDEALAVAQKAVEISKQAGLDENLRVLPLFFNLAEIYFIKEKESEAVELFEFALTGFEKAGAANNLEIAEVSERIASVYFKKGNYEKSINYLRKSLAVREKLNSRPNKDLARINLWLAAIYHRKGNYTESQSYYLASIKINDVLYKPEDDEKRQDIKDFECMVAEKKYKLILREKSEDNSPELQNFYQERKGRFQTANSKSAEFKLSEEGVVNGKAVSLPMPKYPDEAKAKKLSGYVIVRVVIDENGTVSSAEASCGVPEFFQASEKAALKAKFNPTIIDGKPTKVFGNIVYNFIGASSFNAR